ncbi:glycosyltransferase family 4 protein [Rosenbergiella nectarea]|uniref:glycosyltransferase family 4 protein n=1 Tax=Rosenbergiella nectarea TaxID=988801 RepID=UPI001F4E62C3|nr:glycosyltransferase family 4 protein [Rosenbergiella nectarea]
MKKICYFINSDWYFDLHWLERAYAAQKDGYQVHVMTRFEGETFYDKFTKLGFICHPVRLRERSLNLFGFFFSMLDVSLKLSKIEPSIIHSITIKPIIIGGLLSRIKDTPFVANIVGLGRVFDCNGVTYHIIQKLVISIYRYIFKNFKSKIVFEHRKDMDILEEFISFRADQANVIDGAGVDIKIFAYQEEKELIKPIVFFAGRMLKNKGLKTLIEIKSELKEKNIHFDLVVAGIEVPDDPHAIPSSMLAAWHEKGDIVWLGTRRDIAQLITSASIVALPTIYPEGVPRILIEACAIGRPCIAYNSGGCGSIINDGVTGYLITKNNRDDFRDKLEKLLLQPELRKKMGINGRDLVAQRFSSDKIISRTLKLYKILCNI